jgi:hypothetical protein
MLLAIALGSCQHNLREDLSGFLRVTFARPVSATERAGTRSSNWTQSTVEVLCRDCYLQQRLFGDATLFANGCSINMHLDGLDNVEKRRMITNSRREVPRFDVDDIE